MREKGQGIIVCQKKEQERLVRRVKSWFKRSRQSGRVHFETLREGLSLPGTLEALAAKPEQCWTLSEFVKKRLLSTSRLLFLKFLLANRERVSRQELAKVWNVFLEGWDDFLKALQRPVFVDAPDGGYVVCQEDDAYLLAKNGQHGKNSAELLENDKIPDEVIPLSELCCLLVANFPDAKAVPMLEIIEEVKPGTVGAVRDAFGRNLLWYAIHNLETLWFASDCVTSVTRFFREHGCDPENANQAGITWIDLCETLNDDQKKHFYELRNRYGETFSQSVWPDWWRYWRA